MSQKKACKTPGCKGETKIGDLCASCAARRANSVRWSLEGRAKRPRKERPPKGTTPSPGPSEQVTISVSFQGYEGLLKDIQDQAKDQVRSTEGQIIWLLKSAIGN
jgi:hypothetical protein